MTELRFHPSDIERSFIYLQRLRFPDVDNPRPDCLTGDIRVLPHNRFWRTMAQLWGSINPLNTRKQRFTYWMLYKYEHEY